MDKWTDAQRKKAIDDFKTYKLKQKDEATKSNSGLVGTRLPQGRIPMNKVKDYIVKNKNF